MFTKVYETHLNVGEILVRHEQQTNISCGICLTVMFIAMIVSCSAATNQE